KPRARVIRTLVTGLTHAIDEVRGYAASGIGKNLWAIDRKLTLRCVNALAMEAELMQTAADEERSRLLREKEYAECHSGGWVDRVEATVAARVRQYFLEENGIPYNALQTYDPTRWFGAEANSRILVILGEAPAEPAAIEAFGRLAH